MLLIVIEASIRGASSWVSQDGCSISFLQDEKRRGAANKIKKTVFLMFIAISTDFALIKILKKSA
jgi:hypothetical protein